MVRHTQTIRRLLLTNCLSMFDHFDGLALRVKCLYFKEMIVMVIQSSNVQIFKTCPPSPPELNPGYSGSEA